MISGAVMKPDDRSRPDGISDEGGYKDQAQAERPQLGLYTTVAAGVANMVLDAHIIGYEKSVHHAVYGGEYHHGDGWKGKT